MNVIQKSEAIKNGLRKGFQDGSSKMANSTGCVSYKDLKALVADLKAVYAAVDEASALDALEVFAQHWDKKYPKISSSWRENWPISALISSIPRRFGG